MKHLVRPIARLLALSAVALFCASSSFAEGAVFGRFDSALRFDSGAQSLIASGLRGSSFGRADLPRLSKVTPSRFSVVVRGLGKVHFRFDTRWNKRWQSFIVKSPGNVVQDDRNVALVRGEYSVRMRTEKGREHVEGPAAGAFLEQADGSYTLEISFRPPQETQYSRRSFEITAKVNPRTISSKTHLEASIHRMPDSAFLNRDCASSALHEALHDTHDDIVHAESVHSLATEKIVEIRTIADGLFYTNHGNDSNTRIAALVNAADVIYQDQFSARFDIADQITYTSSTDPFSSTTDAELLLDDLTFTNSHSSGVDLVHLFTGRDIDEGVVGVAWIGVVCHSVYNTGLSQDLSNSTAAALVFAHEVGHNFSATHDSGDEYGYIMWPSVILSADSFSPRSKGQVESHLSTRACLSEQEVGGSPTATPTPSATSTAEPAPTGTVSPTPPGEPPATATATPTPTPTPVLKPTERPDYTPSPTPRPTATATPIPTPQPTITPTPLPYELRVVRRKLRNGRMALFAIIKNGRHPVMNVPVQLYGAPLESPQDYVLQSVQNAKRRTSFRLNSSGYFRIDVALPGTQTLQSDVFRYKARLKKRRKKRRQKRRNRKRRQRR